MSGALASVWRRGWAACTARERRWVAAVVVGGFALFLAYYVPAYCYGLGWVEEHDYQHFYEAGLAARGGKDIYLSHLQGYIYPPLFAVLMAPLTVLGYSWSAVAWTLLSASMLTAAGWLIAREMLARFVPGAAGDRLLPWVVASAGTLAVADKARAVLQNGQTDALTMLLVAWAFRSERARPFLCGCLLGAACNIKYHTLVFLVYFLARRRWRECGGMLCGIAAGALAGVPLWGWDRNSDYLRRAGAGMGEMTRVRAEFAPGVAVHAIDWLQSVSITSGLARMVGHLDNTGAFLAAAAAVPAVCFVLGWWMYARTGHALFAGRAGAGERAGERAGLVALEWGGLLAATAIFSPQTTGRHFYLMVFPAIAAAPAVFFPRAGVARWPLVAAWVVMTLGMVLPPAHAPWGDELRRWRFVGGMGWCVLLYFFTALWTMLRWHAAGSAAPSRAGP